MVPVPITPAAGSSTVTAVALTSAGVSAPARTTWIVAAFETAIWVSPLNSVTVPVTRTRSPSLTSTRRLPVPSKTKTPSEVSALPSWSAASSCR